MTIKNLLIVMLAIAFMALTACGGGESAKDMKSESDTSAKAEKSETPSDDGKGIGPVKNVDISPGINEQMATRGQEVFEAKCTACHQFEGKYVGPALAGVTDRRKPEWIMNMILNPEEMIQKDPTAKKLLGEHLTQMTFQDVTREDARALLEYFRKHDKEN